MPPTRYPTVRWKESAMLADELDVPIHMHIHETAAEVRTSVQQSRQAAAAAPAMSSVCCRPDSAGRAHDPAQRRRDRAASASGVHVLHCPESNLKLASGFCPVAALLRPGINVALGTDGAASNNDLDMFGEMRTAALLAKAVHQGCRRAAGRSGAANGDAERRPRTGSGRANRSADAGQMGGYQRGRFEPARNPTALRSGLATGLRRRP